jgi:hypothetical protein
MAPKTAPNQSRKRPRLAGVVLVLAANHHVQLRICRERVAKGVERISRIEAGEQRLVRVAAAVDTLQRAGVAPDFRLGNGAVGLEQADHLPAILSGRNRVADLHVHELSVGPAPDDDLVGAELEHAALNDRDLLTQREPGRLDSAHRHVGGGGGRRLLRQIDDHVQLRRRHGDPRVVANAGRLLDHLDLRAGQSARQLAVGPAPHDEGALRGAGPSHGGREPRRDREYRHEDDHHARDADNRDGGGTEPLRDRADVQRHHREGLSEPPRHVSSGEARR